MHLLTVLQKKRIIVQDGFNRADNALTMGNANTGQAWQALSGTWGISSNKAYLASATLQAVSVIEALIPNVMVSSNVTLSATRADVGLIMRAIDDNNYILITVAKAALDRINIFKKDAGIFTSLASNSAAGNALGVTYLFRVVANGNAITVYRDGIQMVSHTLAGADATKFGTPTKYGVRVNVSGTEDDGNSRFDNFIVEGI